MPLDTSNKDVGVNGVGAGSRPTADKKQKDILAQLQQAVVLQQAGQFDQAEALYRRILAQEPKQANAWHLLGVIKRQRGHAPVALNFFDRALALNPNYAEALSSRGNTLRDLRRPHEALESYNRALALHPEIATLHSNQALAWADLCQPAQSLASCQRALELDPQHPDAHWNAALAHLLMGNFEQGWIEYEWRWHIDATRNTRPSFTQPLWLGKESLQGKTLLLHAEQGMGDTFQFCRYAQVLAAQGAQVLLQVPAALKSVLTCLPGVSQLLAQDEPLPPFDYHCPLLSLPLALGTRLTTIPAPSSYLSPDPEHLASWRQRLGPSDRPRVGLVWSGKTTHKNDANRSLDLHSMMGLMSSSMQFYALQKEVRAHDRVVLDAHPELIDLGPELKNFTDTAAVMTLMDVVITVDTAAAHLAGALGRPVWVLLPYAPDWRWLLERSDSPWYPSARLFRQSALGDWAGVLADVKQALYTGQAQALAQSAQLQQAQTLHQQGQLDAAQALYQTILEREPDNLNVWHLLGVLEKQRGNYHQALQCFEHALALNSQTPVIHFLRGVVLRALKREDEALASYDQALSLKPDYVAAYYNRANLLLELGQVQASLEGYEQALAIKPNFIEALYNRGNVLFQLKRFEQALANYDQLLALKPDYVSGLYSRGLVLHALGRYQEAVDSYDCVLTLQPEHEQAYYSRGNGLQLLGLLNAALASYEQALAFKPDDVDAQYSRGNVLLRLKRPQEAIASYDSVLALKPDFVGAWSNRGVALQADLRIEDSLDSFAHALALNPNYPDARWNQALCQLLLGNFEEGLRNYEYRWQTDFFKNSVRPFTHTHPLWLGQESLEGKTILLHAEQGFGDTIQFCRYVPQIKVLGATVVLEVQPEVHALFNNFPGVDQLVAQGSTLPTFEYHCPLLSLPLACSTRLENIPVMQAYLSAPAPYRAKWADKLGAKKKCRVGLVWSGRPTHVNDQNRSSSLRYFESLLMRQAQFFVLQKDIRAEDQALLNVHPEVMDHSTELMDFADTAALIELMDVVITIDTGVAHLAGAMGKPVWILLPYAPEWRWLLHRQDSPWYSCARLFRQQAVDDWPGVIECVAHELDQFIAKA